MSDLIVLEDKVNISENNLRDKMSSIFNILLIDRTKSTKRCIKNIIWANENYIKYDAEKYSANSEIKFELITGKYDNIIQPRALKAAQLQKKRTRTIAEVFTPMEILKQQNDEIDKNYHNDNLETYTKKTWIEITCGEAPYIATRYNVITGKLIGLDERVGFLDRKLRKINKECNIKDKWKDLVKEAYKASYGFEWNGDSLLLARENLLYTYFDYYNDKWNEEPLLEEIEEIAIIISYNIFQMDGLKCIIPLSDIDTTKKEQLNLFNKIEKINNQTQSKKGQYVKIMNWRENKTEFFKRVKFDVVIGNPPYQENDNAIRGEGAPINASAKPLYNHFFYLAQEITDDKINLIFPARWLVGAGKGLTEFTQKMLNDKHIKSITIFQKSNDVFINTDIKGGVLYLTYDKTYKGEANIKVIDWKKRQHEYKGYLNSCSSGFFIPFKELVNIYKKVISISKETIQKQISTRKPYGLPTDFFKNPAKYSMPEIFDKKNNEDDLSILGLVNNKRVIKYVPKDYPITTGNDTIYKWKFFAGKAMGNGEFGETYPDYPIAAPGEIATETFIRIGNFDSKEEAEALKKYFCTKFFRTMLGIAKATQDATSKVYCFVPNQNFGKDSDIDWNEDIEKIDVQLYKKYKLNASEIKFIEENVK